MKIAFVNDTFLVGRGADQVVYEIARRLGKKHEVTVFAFKADFEPDNFTVRVIPGEKLVTGGWCDFLFLKKLISIRKATKGFDIVNLHHSFLGVALFGRKRVVTYNGSPKMRLAENNPLRRALRSLASLATTFLLRYSTRVIAISKYIKSTLTTLGVPKAKIEVVYDGSYENTDISKEDKNYIFFVGRLEIHKKVDELVRASEALGFDLVVAGDGPERENLEKLIRSLEAPTKLLGVISEKEKIKLYKGCSFFASASRWEGFGLPFIEAAKFGKPSVGYDNGSISEVVRRDETGFLANDEEGFLEYCKNLVEDADLRKKMGDRAYEFSKNFSWDKTSEEYESIFKKIVEEKTARNF